MISVGKQKAKFAAVFANTFSLLYDKLPNFVISLIPRTDRWRFARHIRTNWCNRNIINGRVLQAIVQCLQFANWKAPCSESFFKEASNPFGVMCDFNHRVLNFAPAQKIFPAKSNAGNSFHFQNLRRLFRAAEGELRLLAGFFAHELFAQRRLRGDDEDFFFVVQNFRATSARANEVK